MDEKYYYHVVTVKPMKVGQHIVFDENNVSEVYKRVMAELENVEQIYSNPSNYDIEELNHHTKVALRELALEKLRKKEYSNYPSRLRSLYVSKDLKDSEMWANSFIKKGREVFQIVKLKTKGNEFTGDAYNCFNPTFDENENLKRAINYWENLDNKEGKNPIYETIIDGDIEITEIIKEY